MGADYNTNPYLVIAKVKERLSIRKQAAQKFDVEWFNFTKLCELEVRKQYQTEISNRFVALENLNDSKYITVLGKTLKLISRPQLKKV
jgi:hypothetical protein